MFKINGYVWLLRFVPFDDPNLMRSDGSWTIGMCDRDKQMIFVNENLKGDLLKRVLCHEMTHAAMFSYHIDLSIDQEELLADLIATYGEQIVIITNKIFNKLKEQI